jgi:hypothetical protein
MAEQSARFPWPVQQDYLDACLESCWFGEKCQDIGAVDAEQNAGAAHGWSLSQPSWRILGDEQVDYFA